MSESGFSFRHVELLNEEIEELKKKVERYEKALIEISESCPKLNCVEDLIKIAEKELSN